MIFATSSMLLLLVYLSMGRSLALLVKHRKKRDYVVGLPYARYLKGLSLSCSEISMSRIGQIGFAQTETKVPPCLGALVLKDEYELAGLSPIALVEWTSEMKTK